MNLFIGMLFAALAVVVKAEKEIHIDWSDVQPISELYKLSGNRRIFDGISASVSQFPYQAGLVITASGSQNLCGGSLISTTRVLTAAHCFEDFSLVLVILGAHLLRQEESTQVRINVRKSGVVSHALYDPNTLHNDIAMIKLPSSVTFNNFIRPIALAEGTNHFTDDTAVISGWGHFDKSKKNSLFLRFANLKIITNSQCSNQFEFIIDSTICAKGQNNVGECDGDSGGPLAVIKNGKSLLVGVASYISDSGCGHELPTAFARVSSFIKWIKLNM